MARLQVYLLLVLSLSAWQCLAKRRRPLHDEDAIGTPTPQVGGLTVLEPPKGWPFNELRPQDRESSLEPALYGEVGPGEMQAASSEMEPQWYEPSRTRIPVDQEIPDQLQEASEQTATWYDPWTDRQGRIMSARQEQDRFNSQEEPYAAASEQIETAETRRPVSVAAHKDDSTAPETTTWAPTMRYKKKRPKPSSISGLPQTQQQQRNQPSPPKPAPQEPQQNENSSEIKSKPKMKRVNKRKPVSASSSDTSVKVGYSIGFAPNGPGDQPEYGGAHRGSVQSEVIHGQGAVSYSSAHLGKGSSASSPVIQGRPIFVPPFPNEELPAPQPLIGDGHFESPSPTKTNLFIPSKSIHEPQLYHRKPPKAKTSILHINDGTDFKWQDVGNGIEVSAPITPNGLRGGYRDSIPIMEDHGEEEPEDRPQISFPAGPQIPSFPSPNSFDHNYALEHSTQFDQSNAVFGGIPSSKIRTKHPFSFPHYSPTNHVTDNHSFKGFTTTSYQDFMKGFSSSLRRPHSYSGPKIPEGLKIDGASSPYGIGQIYYIPNSKPRGKPIPVVMMPLSQLLELQASLASSNVQTAKLPQGTDFQSHFGDQRGVLSKHRPLHKPISHDFHRPQGHNLSPKVKITKSVPVYEEHTIMSPNKISSQWPPKETVEVQHFYMPIEQFDALKSNRLAPGPEPMVQKSGIGVPRPVRTAHRLRPAAG